MGTVADFGTVIQAVYEVFNIPFYLLGFEMSFWQIFLWLIVAGIIAWVIRSIFNV